MVAMTMQDGGLFRQFLKWIGVGGQLPEEPDKKNGGVEIILYPTSKPLLPHSMRRDTQVQFISRWIRWRSHRDMVAQTQDLFRSLRPTVQMTLRALSFSEFEALSKLSHKQVAAWLRGEIDCYGESLWLRPGHGQAPCVRMGLLDDVQAERIDRAVMDFYAYDADVEFD